MGNAKLSASNEAVLYVHVTPKSGRDEIVGIQASQGTSSSDGAAAVELRIRVTAPPDNGKANKAVCKVVASALDVPKTAVSVASGETSRHKRLAIACEQSIVDAYLLSFPQTN